MKRIKNLLLFIAILVCAFVGLWTALENAAVVPVYLLGFELPAFSVGLWLVVMLAVGTLLGMLASMPLIMRFRAENRRLKRTQFGQSANER